MTWTKSEIRAARKHPLLPILRARGLRLQPLLDGNFRIIEHNDLIVKHCYWRWPSRGIDGNAIDYFMLVEGKSFNQAMEIIATGKSPANHSEKRSKLASYTSAPTY
jgi:hypothetical protein